MNIDQQYELTIRLGVFIGVFVVMAMFELFLPRRERCLPRPKRWFTNFSLVIIDSVAIRLLVPVLAVATAETAQAKGWGVLALANLPAWLELLIAIIVLDMLIYAQHVLTHKVSILWRFHKVHHADRDIDVTTGARFHPVEIVLSMFYKLACIAVIGAPALAVFVFEVVLNASAMFNHSNVRLPLGVDALLRKFVVTPDMHRVHHSAIRKETDSNYGFFLSIWDRLFKTYTAQPQTGHDDMTIGLPEHQSNDPASLLWSLKIPFK